MNQGIICKDLILDTSTSLSNSYKYGIETHVQTLGDFPSISLHDKLTKAL